MGQFLEVVIFKRSLIPQGRLPVGKTQCQLSGDGDAILPVWSKVILRDSGHRHFQKGNFVSNQTLPIVKRFKNEKKKKTPTTYTIKQIELKRHWLFLVVFEKSRLRF